MLTITKFAVNQDGQILRSMVNHLNDVYNEIVPATFKDYDIIDKHDFVNVLEEAINIIKQDTMDEDILRIESDGLE